MLMKPFFALMLIFCCGYVQSQNKLYIGHYNLENLFDTIDQKNVMDEEFLPNGKNKWTKERYTQKLEHMAEVIAALNKDEKLAILSVCEVENKGVLEDLIKQKSIKKLKLNIAHIDSRDLRGIDVAFLYDAKQFKPKNIIAEQPDRFADSAFISRPILIMSGTTPYGNAVFFANHWPSRSAGTEISAPRRMATAKLLAYLVDSTTKANPDAMIFALGDLNDGPHDASLLWVKTHTKLTNAMEDSSSFAGRHYGSHYYKGEWGVLDQILYEMPQNKTLWKATATFNHFPFLLESEGKYKGTPYRTFVGSKYTGGYSDHLPVTLNIEFR
jgi:hypothetical protein